MTATRFVVVHLTGLVSVIAGSVVVVADSVVVIAGLTRNPDGV
ncbi:MAG: hypothetical protein V4669_11895 [Pseudomonadota bacterium]